MDEVIHMRVLVRCKIACSGASPLSVRSLTSLGFSSSPAATAGCSVSVASGAGTGASSSAMAKERWVPLGGRTVGGSRAGLVLPPLTDAARSQALRLCAWKQHQTRRWGFKRRSSDDGRGRGPPTAHTRRRRRRKNEPGCCITGFDDDLNTVVNTLAEERERDGPTPCPTKAGLPGMSQSHGHAKCSGYYELRVSCAASAWRII